MEQKIKPTLPELTEAPVVKKRIFTYGELLDAKTEEVPTLFYPTFIKQGIAICYGAPDCGKSMFLRQMCAHVAYGKDFLGFKYKGIKHKAVYFSSEDDEGITAPVVKRNQKALQLNEEARNNLRFVFDYTAEELPGLLEEILTEESADLVIIDAFGDAFKGKSTNDTTEIRSFYKTFVAIAKKHECLIIFNHHIAKSALKIAPGKETALGSEAVVSAPRLGMEIRRDPNNPEFTHLCFTKANYLGRDYKNSSFAMTMDEASLTFTATGERVPFEQLVKKDGIGKDRTQKKAEDASIERHHSVLFKIFGNDVLRNQSQINRGIQREFCISDKPARNFMDYYLEQGWIEEAGKVGRSIVYKHIVKT